MFYILTGFVFGALIPYRSRRFAKFMPATAAYAIYRLIKPNKKSSKRNDKYKRLLKDYKLRSFVYACVSALLSGLVLYRLGDANICWWLGFVWILLLLTEIDIKMFLLPDILTVPLLICGFVFATISNPFISPVESSIAALAGYIIPVIATLAMLWRSVDAFGGGDIKLLTAIGAWLGVEPLIYTILASCVIFGIYSLIKRQRAGAFGPALAVGAILVLLSVF